MSRDFFMPDDLQTSPETSPVAASQPDAVRATVPRLKVVLGLASDMRVPYAECPRGLTAVPHFLEQFGHEVIYLKASDALRPWRVISMLKEWKPDIILTHLRPVLMLGLLRRLGLIRCPLVHVWDDYYAIQHRLPTWFIWPFEVLSVRWADYIVSVSPFNLHLAKKWGLPCEYIPYGISPDQRPTKVKLESKRTKIVYLGAQFRYKGTFELVQSVRDLDCDLFMVGPIDPELPPISPPNVHFVGEIPQPEVQAVLAQADMLLNSSNQDSNFKWYDYIAAGKPMVGVKGRPEWFLKDGEDALLVDDFRAGIRRLLADPALGRRLADNVKKRPVLTWEDVSRKFETMLARVSRLFNQQR